MLRTRLITMTKVLKRAARDVVSPIEIPIAKRQKTAPGTRQPGDEYLEDILRYMEHIEVCTSEYAIKIRVTPGMLT